MLVPTSPRSSRRPTFEVTVIGLASDTHVIRCGAVWRVADGV